MMTTMHLEAVRTLRTNKNEAMITQAPITETGDQGYWLTSWALNYLY